MSAQGSAAPGDGVGVSEGALPAVVPLSLPRTTRLAWELGTRVVEDAESTPEGAWTHRSGWRLSMFSVTEHTVVLRVRTPVGRERFYNAACPDVSELGDALGGAAAWRRTA
jgi:hypothetical protein